MLRRLAKGVSSAARGHGLGLPGSPSSGSAAASAARRLLGAPSPAAGRAGMPGSFVRAFSSGSPAGCSASSASARRCVSNICTAVASRWVNTSSTYGDSKDSGEDGSAQQDLEITGLTLQSTRSQPLDQNEPNLVDPNVYFRENPILVDLDNEYVSDRGGRNQKKVPDDIRDTFHSLLDLVIVHHLNNKALVEALEEGNLMIDADTGKFVLIEIKYHRLNAGREKMDFEKLHERIVMYVEKRHGKGSTKLLPDDFKDMLKKLKADCLNVKLLYLHPMFLSWVDRVLFRTLSDVCVRLPGAYLRKTKSPEDLKRKLLKIISAMPYVSRVVPGEDSSQFMESIIANNEILNAANTFREQEKQQRKDDKVKLAEWRKRGKEAKKANKVKHAATAAAGVPPKEKHEKSATAAAGGAKGPTGAHSSKASGQGPKGKRKRAFSTKASGGKAEAAVPRKINQEKLNNGFRLFALNRDVISHMYEIAKRINKTITLEKLIEMLHAVFPAFEYKLLDLLEEEGIWSNFPMAKMLKIPARKLEAIIERDEIRLARYRTSEKKETQKAVELREQE